MQRRWLYIADVAVSNPARHIVSSIYCLVDFSVSLPLRPFHLLTNLGIKVPCHRINELFTGSQGTFSRRNYVLILSCICLYFPPLSRVGCRNAFFHLMNIVSIGRVQKTDDQLSHLWAIDMSCSLCFHVFCLLFLSLYLFAIFILTTTRLILVK